MTPAPSVHKTYAEVLSDATNKEPASSSKSKPKPNRPKKRSQPLVVSMGSSLTWGLGQKLNKRGLDGPNYCYSGADIPWLRERVPHAIKSENAPDQVFFQIGGNDLHNGAPPHLVNIEFENLISDVRRIAPNSQIVFGKIPYRTDNINLHKRINFVNKYLEDRGTRGDGVACIDARPPFPNFYSMPELIHFTKKGERIYGDKVASQLINFQSDILTNRV